MSSRPDIDAIRPTVVIDTREQEPLVFRELPSEGGTLYAGDYSFQGAEEWFAVERKSIDDIVGCCGPERERFTHELHRLRGYRFKRLLLIGGWTTITQHRYRSRMEPVSVLHSLYAFEVRYDVPVVMVPEPEAGAALVERWVRWAAYNALCDTGEIWKRYNATREAGHDDRQMQVG